MFVNDCIQVGFCVDPYHASGSAPAPMTLGDVNQIMNFIQPYHTVLFFEDIVPGPDVNPYVLRFFENYDLERSLNDIGKYFSNRKLFMWSHPPRKTLYGKVFLANIVLMPFEQVVLILRKYHLDV